MPYALPPPGSEPLTAERWDSRSEGSGLPEAGGRFTPGNGAVASPASCFAALPEVTQRATGEAWRNPWAIDLASSRLWTLEGEFVGVEASSTIASAATLSRSGSARVGSGGAVSKRDVWVRVGGELVRGDTIVGISVGRGRAYQSYKLLLKVTGHRDHLVIDSGIVALRDDPSKDECHEQATALADDFVNTLARGAALPTGALIRISPDGEGDDDAAEWVLTPLG